MEQELFELAAKACSGKGVSASGSSKGGAAGDRWGTARDNPIIPNSNTSKATDVAVRAFLKYLKDKKQLDITAEQLVLKQPEDIVKDLEDYALLVSSWNSS